MDQNESKHCHCDELREQIRKLQTDNIELIKECAVNRKYRELHALKAAVMTKFSVVFSLITFSLLLFLVILVVVMLLRGHNDMPNFAKQEIDKLKEEKDDLERMLLKALRDKEKSDQECQELQREIRHHRFLQQQQQIEIARLSAKFSIFLTYCTFWYFCDILHVLVFLDILHVLVVYLQLVFIVMLIFTMTMMMNQMAVMLAVIVTIILQI